MLRYLKIVNFKSWEQLEVDISPITGLFGPNSSGKSSLLQFVLMLKQTKETMDRSLAIDLGTSKSYANLGTFRDIIFSHDIERELTWSITWRLPSELTIIDPLASRKTILFKGQEMSLYATVELRNQQPSTSMIQYQFNDQSFLLERKKSKQTSFSIKSKGDNSRFRFIRNQGRVWDIPGPIKSYAFPDQAKTYYQNAGFLGDLEFSYEEFIDRIFYLGPLREYPKREYVWSGYSPLDVGHRGERVVDALLAAQSRKEKRSLGYRKKKMAFEEIIAYWLKELGLIYDFKVIEIAKDSNLYKVEIKRDAMSTPVLITDVGFGLSQFLPVLVLLYYVPEHSIILLEQPEIHLHPAVQSGLADVIINAVKTRNIQVIVESHSEHLLRRLQRRTAESKIENANISLYFNETKQGKSAITKLNLNLFGEIDNWPKNFFGDEFGEVAATRKAAIKRKMSGSQ
jgi:predicted ATPase